jgi:uncharacterized membrane protein YsdA (DUF1294 family)/cold shock CspA family protein
MRDQGRLIEWFDDKGYGFIQPNDTGKDRVFIHIKDFAKQGPRPIVGCALDYQVILDEKGRYKAQKVVYLKASQVRQNTKVQPKNVVKFKKKIQPMAIFCFSYFVVLAILTMTKMLNGMAFLFVSIVNVATYWFYAQDKEAAQLNTRRVAENTLHILAFLGGWPAAWLAQERLRHKTQKQPFRRIYFCTIVLNIILIIWLISPLNTLHI